MVASAVDRCLDHLRPEFRVRVEALLEACRAEGLGFEVYEGFRSRERQGWLFAQGRTAPGKVVTQAAPGQSFHEYGAAADLVRRVEGRWSWDMSGDQARKWFRMRRLAGVVGLAVLKWDYPHVQLSGVTLQDLQRLAVAGGVGHGNV